MFSCKIHECGEKMTAIADAGLIGRTITGREMEVSISEQFYGNSNMGEKEALLLIRGSTIINAIGKNSVELLVRKGFVNPEAILEIGGIPHAQVICTKSR